MRLVELADSELASRLEPAVAIHGRLDSARREIETRPSRVLANAIVPGHWQARVVDLLQRYVRCGDPYYGFLRLRCMNPDFTKKGERIVPYS